MVVDRVIESNDEEGASLSAEVNVYESAMAVISAWGYELGVQADFEDLYNWSAKKGTFFFYADDPIALLGVIAIHKHRAPERARPYWWSTNGSKYDELTRAADERLENLRRLVEKQGFPAQVRHQLRQSAGDTRVAAKAVGVSRDELTMILELPEFHQIRDEF